METVTETTSAATRLKWRFIEAERLAALDATGRALYAGLSALRVRLAREIGIPAYRVLTNRQLLVVCECRPYDVEALAIVAGIGPLTLRAYGADIIAAVRALLELDRGV